MLSLALWLSVTTSAAESLSSTAAALSAISSAPESSIDRALASPTAAQAITTGAMAAMWSQPDVSYVHLHLEAHLGMSKTWLAVRLAPELTLALKKTFFHRKIKLHLVPTSLQA